MAKVWWQSSDDQQTPAWRMMNLRTDVICMGEGLVSIGSLLIKKSVTSRKGKYMRILAISGSLRASSTNTALLQATAALAPQNMEITIYDGLADLPHFSPDLDGDDPPASVHHLRQLLQAAEGVLICTPEYAFGVPGVLKNALDWTVSSGEFYGKPVAAISASPSPTGGDKAHASLLLTLTALGAHVPEGGKLNIAAVGKKLNVNGEVSDLETGQALRSVLDALALTIEA
jgi:chromate reductase, NAD(P)H dehydrogenase (quinone)